MPVELSIHLNTNAREDGILYARIGEQSQRAEGWRETVCGRRQGSGMLGAWERMLLYAGVRRHTAKRCEKGRHQRARGSREGSADWEKKTGCQWWEGMLL